MRRDWRCNNVSIYSLAKQKVFYHDFSLASKNIAIKNGLHAYNNKYGLKTFTALGI